jgi:hypothetical protein
MPCCGQKRLAPSPAQVPASNQHWMRPAARVNTAVFEYLGNRVLTVIGQGTGRQYRFVGHGARLTVDGRDRSSLAAVPGLRVLPARP